MATHINKFFYLTLEKHLVKFPFYLLDKCFLHHSCNKNSYSTQNEITGDYKNYLACCLEIYL